MKALLKAHGYSLPVKQRLRGLRSSLSLRTRETLEPRMARHHDARRAVYFSGRRHQLRHQCSLSEDGTAYHLRLLRD